MNRLSEAEREALDRASTVFGWQHLARYSGKSTEWLNLTLLAIVRSARADVAARLASVEALADEPIAPYPADCGCSHGMGFQFHRFPCRYAGDIPKSALRAVLGSDAHTEQKGVRPPTPEQRASGSTGEQAEPAPIEGHAFVSGGLFVMRCECGWVGMTVTHHDHLRAIDTHTEQKGTGE